MRFSMHCTKHRGWLALLGLALAGLPLLALAAGEPQIPGTRGPNPAGPPGSENVRGACRADVERLCGDVQPGGGARRQCLRQHQNDLSPACHERVSRIRQRMAQVRQACSGEAQRLCADVQPGHGAILRCMRQHESQLSNECREALPQRRAAR
jgi:hypothetical protein